MLLNKFFFYKSTPNTQKNHRTVSSNFRKQINLCICQLCLHYLRQKSFVYINMLWDEIGRLSSSIWTPDTKSFKILFWYIEHFKSLIIHNKGKCLSVFLEWFKWECRKSGHMNAKPVIREGILLFFLISCRFIEIFHVLEILLPPSKDSYGN